MSTPFIQDLKCLGTMVGFGIGYLAVMLAAALLGAGVLQAMAWIIITMVEFI